MESNGELLSSRSSPPELPPALFLNLLFAGLEGKLADALGELRYMRVQECYLLILLSDCILKMRQVCALLAPRPRVLILRLS